MVGAGRPEERGQSQGAGGQGRGRREAPGVVASIAHREDVTPRWVQKLPVSPELRHPWGRGFQACFPRVSLPVTSPCDSCEWCPPVPLPRLG